MAPNRTSKPNINSSFSSQLLSSSFSIMDDDDFQDLPSPSLSIASRTSSLPPRLKPQNSTVIRPPKKLKNQKPIVHGKENCIFNETEVDLGCGLDSIEPTLDLFKPKGDTYYLHSNNSIESRLLNSSGQEEEKIDDEESLEGSTQLDELLKLCADRDEPDNDNAINASEGENEVLISCPLCGVDISGLSDDMRQTHTNECLDKLEGSTDVAVRDDDTGANQCPGQVLDGSPLLSSKKAVDVSPVAKWLHNLGLSKYEEIFVKQEVDWDTLQWLTDEDLCSIGITTLGPRKKILHAIKELRNEPTRTAEPEEDFSKGVANETKQGTNKLITDFFPGHFSERKRGVVTTNGQNSARKSQAKSSHKSTAKKDRVRNGKQKDVPLWCCIAGTPFRVDAFKYLRRDCSHWFLSHFHLDHYQGLTKSFCHGTIYCSLITAKLVNHKIGISWDKIQVLPLNQKINIAGIDVTCFDANHCPGAIIILFEPPTGKPVLHTGDFRFCDEMTEMPILQSCRIHTLILDTTYCNPQYDFPKQDTIIQFVIDAIQAEAFNPKALFLIGSYTIGKERVFIEVARALRKKIYVTAAKLRILECLGFPKEDMEWFTLNEQESHIHVVPMWTIASFKRLKHMTNQYMSRFSLIVAFSPTGWSFGKGKKSTGKRWQQGTIIRYEVPYSEHSSFTELKEFVKFISPADIVPSVNNHGPDSHNSMVSQLLS